VSWPEVAIGGTLLAATAASFVVLHPPDEPRWTGGILMDEWVRDRLGAESEQGARKARTVSDVFYFSLLGYALVDPSIASLAHGWVVGGQVMGINLLAMSVAAFPTVALELNLGRARPSGGNDSFPSGHTAVAFASATLTCVHHFRMPLYGGGAAEVINCAAALAAATTTGAARMIGDRHWSTDVAVGATFGVASGYLIPTLLHYEASASNNGAQQAAASEVAILSGSLYPLLGRHEIGLGYAAVF
jgi:membrane-associated phospholipid phosphatase